MSLCLQNGSLNLCVMQQSENEVVLSLTGKGASVPAAVIPYSVFTPYSLGRPWKLEKSCFHSVSDSDKNFLAFLDESEICQKELNKIVGQVNELHINNTRVANMQLENATKQKKLHFVRKRC